MKKKLAAILVLTLAIGLMGNAYAHTMEVVGDNKIEIGWKNEPPVVGIDNEITLTVTTATAFDKAEAEKEDQAMAGMDMGEDSSSDSMNSMNDTMTHDEMNQDNMTSNSHGMNNMNMTTGKDEHANEHAMDNNSKDTKEHSMGEPITTGILKGFTAAVILGNDSYPLNFVEDSKYPGIYHAPFTPTKTGYPMVHIAGTLAGEDVDITFHPEQVAKLNVIRPLQQMKHGINPGDTQCKEGLDLYKHVGNDKAVCLKPATGEKLMKRGVVELF